MLKATETLGEGASSCSSGRGEAGGGDRGERGGAGVLSKRRRVDEEEEEDEVDEETKHKPMPGDTPPPIAKDMLDRWYAARRARLGLPPPITSLPTIPLTQPSCRSRHTNELHTSRS